MPEALQTLRSLPARLFVCTAKPHVFAVPILEHFGLTSVFAGIYGADLEGRFDDKGLLIDLMIEEENIDPARTIMVGDRANDVRAAARHGIPTVGALWGYGGREELTEAGAAGFFGAPDRLFGGGEGMGGGERGGADPLGEGRQGGALLLGGGIEGSEGTRGF